MSGPEQGSGASIEGVPDNPAPFPPFEVATSERIYDSSWVGLRKDMLQLPSGELQEHHVIEICNAACVVPLRPDGRIVMIGQARYVHGKTHWEVPAGRIEDGEKPEIAAARELLEETGYAGKTLIKLPGFYPTNGISAHWCHLFAALDCELVAEQSLDPAERIIVDTFTPAEVDAMLVAGRIEDGFTALALLYARLLQPGRT